MTSPVWFNRNVGFGRCCIRGTGIRVGVVVSRWFAGESIIHLHYDYGLSVQRIEAAIRWYVRRYHVRDRRARPKIAVGVIIAHPSDD